MTCNQEQSHGNRYLRKRQSMRQVYSGQILTWSVRHNLSSSILLQANIRLAILIRIYATKETSAGVTEGGEVGDNLLRSALRERLASGCEMSGFEKSRSKDRPLQGME